MNLSISRRTIAFASALFAIAALVPTHTRGQAAGGDGAAVRAALSMFDGVRHEKLPNGLNVYLKPIPGSPVVTSMVAYKVGSADEDLDQTGLSHYLEHLLFKGTAKLKPGDIDRITLRNGGANNAYTTEDMTVYHFDFAADRWEHALEIEADRMRNVRIDAEHEFEQEKGAVIAELEQGEDAPWDLELKAILPLLFSVGPYGHPIIGEAEHVRRATAEVIKAHYDKWYHPNNASLVLVGGFDSDKALARVKELFGPIPAGKLPERKKVPAAKRDGPVKLEITSKFEATRMVMGFNGTAADSPDAPALDIAAAVLSQGKLARLYRKLVEDERLANSASAYNFGGRYPGWFGVQVELLKDKEKDRELVEKLVLSEIAKLRDRPIAEAELNRVRRGLIADEIFNHESPHDLGDKIAQGVTVMNLEWTRNYLKQLVAVTPADVQAAVKKHIDPFRRVTVWSIQKEEAQLRADQLRLMPKPRGPAPQSRAGLRPGATGLRRRPGTAALQAGAAAPAADFSFKDAQRAVLPNGLTLLLLENRRLPIVSAEAHVRNTHLLEPGDKAGVVQLIGSLLTEGTTKREGRQISETIENVGGVLSMDRTGGHVQVLSPDRRLGLEVFLECLMLPNFPQAAFDREKERLITDIEDAESEPDTKAVNRFRELVYGGHPFGRPAHGRLKAVQALTPADCTAAHRRLFVPNNTILAIVGDFDAKQVIDEVTKLTADWKPGELPKPEPAAPPKRDKFHQELITMEDAAQLHFYMGHLGVVRKDPDYYKLVVMDYVLGTGPGFTDRLSGRLRDREGLAYTVSANISSSADTERGLFTCHIGTGPDNFAKVKAGFLEEIERIRKEEPKAEEVEDAKRYLIGSLPFNFTTNMKIAGQMLGAERLGLGFNYLSEYRKAVSEVTAAEVKAVAAKHLHPDALVLVAVGAIDKNGKPVKRE